MDTIALLSHGAPEAPIAYRGGVPVTALRFLSDAETPGAAACRPGTTC